MLLPSLLALLPVTQTTMMGWSAPSGKDYAIIVPGGKTVLPNGRWLTPAGKRLYTGENLWQVIMSPDGKTVVGFARDELSIYTDLGSEKPTRKVIASKDLAPAGAFTRDGKYLIISNGDAGTIELIRTSDWTSDRKISANQYGFKESFINDVAVSKDGLVVFGVDIAHQRVVVFDLSTNAVVGTKPAGRQPYTLAVSRDETRLFVANIGLFNYSLVPPPDIAGYSTRGLAIPAFGFPSPEAEKGVRKEGRNVPGLGSARVPDAQSVYMYDIKAPNKPTLKKQVKSGVLIHAPADGGKSAGGSAPNELLIHGPRLYVSNANNDTISVFDAMTLALQKTIKITPHESLAKYRGVIPSGMAMNKEGTRLYVCESGLNAIAVIDPIKGTVLGHIPTGWFPMQVSLSPDDKSLIIATQKGLGRGPYGKYHPRPETDERYGLVPMPGMINIQPVPSNAELATMTKQVLANNGLVPKAIPYNPIAGAPGKPSSKIKYVVFITKENHTFDGIFGGLKGAKGDVRYAEFGMTGWIQEKGQDERVPIMPNHIRLAEQFSISDNFYMEPVASGDGHRWLVGVYPSLWTSRVFYSGWDHRRTKDAPGRLASFGSNGSQIPEDYLENGSIWEHLDRNKITFRNYGEGYELPDNDEGPMTNKSGAYTMVNYPMPKCLYDNTCFNFPAYNNNIPDIARSDWFIEDIEENYRKKGKALPRFLNIAICNDHGAAANPKQGFPYECSYMADNDLALGRIVEYLSRQPEWKEMAIFVTQDDSGGDGDHIDRHRSFVMAIGPYCKRGYVTNDHTSIMSIIKTIYQLFGLGPNNMFDAVATDLSDMFTDTPDFTPYTPVMTDPRVFKPEDTFDPTDPKFERRRSQRPQFRMDDPKFVDQYMDSRRGGSQPKP